MEKKRKKDSRKIAPKKMETKPQPRLEKKEVLNEKDRMILQDVEHIIWNPDMLKNLKKGKPQPPNGYSKNKKPLK
ncbi:hypothetical protein MUP79_00865 [Candidatus Bathyarchaeota archaeon]|nr:hypothetical protein [Candidatus Bathyarchaeota archaeon]